MSSDKMYFQIKNTNVKICPILYIFRCVFVLVLLRSTDAQNNITLSILKHKDEVYCTLSKDATDAIMWDSQYEETSYDYYNITKSGSLGEKSWRLENSWENEFGFDPILDYRWERISLQKQCYYELPKAKSYKISISIQGTDKLYVCKTKTERCFRLGGLNGNYLAEKYCTNFKTIPTIKDWIHFALTLKGRLLTIKRYGESKSILYELLFDPNFLIIDSVWKLHSFNVYSANKSGEVKLHIEDDLLRIDDYICLGLLVKVPTENCNGLRLTLRNNATHTIADAVSSKRDEWEEVKLCGKITSNNVTLLIQSPELRSSKFYVADIIRKINREDIRMKAIATPEESYCCHAIASSTKICLRDIGQYDITKSIKANMHCPFTTIGSDCIPCKMFFNQAFCKNVPICESTPSRDIVCSCPSGYVGKGCTEKCPIGYHGFNCAERCDSCERCNHVTGLCPTNTWVNSCYPRVMHQHNYVSNILAVNSPTRYELPEKGSKNLNYFWNETSNVLVLKWNDTNIDHVAIYRPNRSVPYCIFSKEESEYICELTVSSSSDITLEVHSYNNYSGESSCISLVDISVPPKTPKFSKDPTIVNITATSVTILLPDILQIDGEKSVLYIIITDTQSASKNRKVNFQFQEIFRQANIDTKLKAWVALKNLLSNVSEHQIKEHKILVISKSQLSTSHKFTFLLSNEYKNITRYSTYTLQLATVSQFNYYLLLLLLLVPVTGIIIYCIHRRYKRGRINSTKLQDVHEDGVMPSVRTFIQTSAGTSEVKIKCSKFIKLEDLQDYMKECLITEELEQQYEMLSLEYTESNCYRTDLGTRSTNQNEDIVLGNYVHRPSKETNYMATDYIHGYNSDRVYIPTWIPHSDEVEIFWAMTWQEHVKYIVMLSSLWEMEEGIVTKYWPDITDTKIYGEISVTFVEKIVYAEYETKILKISFRGRERKVHHFHFRSWPGSDPSFYPESFASFLKKVVTIPQSNSPIVVQCSDGVEKSGTLILCDICVRMAMETGEVDVYHRLYKLRKQRPNMVNSINHFKLTHLMVYLCTVAPDYTIECTEQMEERANKMMSFNKLFDQMVYIEEAFWQNDAAYNTYDRAADRIIDDKNRFRDILPDTYARIILKPRSLWDQASSYINAVKVNGFCTPSKFIVTQYPLPHTLGDFWRLVEQQDISLVICLNDLDLSDRTCCKFYPSSNTIMKPIPSMRITSINTVNEDYYNISTINLTNSNQEEEDRIIKIIHLKNWNYSMAHPQTPEHLLAVYDKMNTLARSTNPILITCFDGALASGLYTSTCCVIDKIKMEHVCDVCLAIKIVRKSREQFIRRPEQLCFLYRCAVEYVNQLSDYSNFFIKK